MNYTHLGRSGLQVSRLCLGTMNFGPETSEADSFTIMDRALEVGINFFDTANVYGWKRGEGWTEQILGRWLSQGGGRREKIVLATKVYGTMGDWPNQSRLSAHHIIRACEASLRRMRTDTIDLYQMHHVDRDTPWEEIWQAMETLVRQGKVTYIGTSNFAGWHLAQAAESARARHFMGPVSEQSLYNLLDRTLELEVIPACEHYGLGLIPYSPLKGGILGGALKKQSEGRRTSERSQARIAEHRPALEAYEALCSRIGVEPAHVALAWLLSKPVVTAPIVGPRTLAQLDSALKALSVTLDEETLRELETIFPAPAARLLKHTRGREGECAAGGTVGRRQSIHPPQDHAMKVSLVGLLASLVLASSALASSPPPGVGANRAPPPPTRVQPPPPPPPARHADEVVISRSEFTKELERLERELAKIRREVQRKNQSDIDDVSRGLAKLRQELARADRYDDRDRRDRDQRSDRDRRDDHRGLRAVSDHELGEVRQAVARQSFGAEKVRILAEAARTRYFEVGQVIQLLTAFTFDSDRVEALKVLVPRTLDARHNGFRILEQFRFDSDRKKAQQVLATATF